tara:strand:+ start:1489 stop:2865 length:1377 start_codon:yes stop_codon:yes gene_type:complete
MSGITRSISSKIFRDMNRSLKENDNELYNLIKEEGVRQTKGLELIASENFTPKSVMECLGSVLTNKYSEGLPGARYYGGNEVIDKIEKLCIERALGAYRLDKNNWGVNVQPYSGSVANVAAYAGILNPHDRIMGLDLPSGGHLSHGYYTAKKKISSTSIVYESLPYHVDSNGYIDYKELELMASNFKPKLIICGASAYPRDFDYKKFREIADKNNSYLLCDMAHISGLVATQQMENPFDYCDIVTTTTHKTLGGPRSGMIFFKKELEDQMNFAVFPGLQGGPHQHQIAGVAAQLKEVMEPSFTEYIIQVKKNAKVMASCLMDMGYKVMTDGTENHLILVSLRDKGITGSKIEKICELVDISINKNSVAGDTSALSPGGIRLGTAALTSRGFDESNFETVCNFLDRCIKLALKIQNDKGKKMKDFLKDIDENIEIIELRKDVVSFASEFPLYDFISMDR